MVSQRPNKTQTRWRSVVVSQVVYSGSMWTRPPAWSDWSIEGKSWLKLLTCPSRFDLIDGKVHNVFVEKDDPSPTWVQSQQDVDYAVQKRMTDSFHYKRELEDAYGFRTSVKDYKGIMQEIPAFGIGEKEENGKKKLFEYVNGSLLKPVPIVPKGA